MGHWGSPNPPPVVSTSWRYRPPFFPLHEMALELVYRANGGVCVPLPRGPTAGPGRCRLSQPSLWCRGVGLCSRFGVFRLTPNLSRSNAAACLSGAVCVCVCVCVCCVGGVGPPGSHAPPKGACNRFRPKKGGDARLRTPVDSSTGVPDTPTPQNPLGPGGFKKKKEKRKKKKRVVLLGARRDASKPGMCSCGRLSNEIAEAAQADTW